MLRITIKEHKAKETSVILEFTYNQMLISLDIDLLGYYFWDELIEETFKTFEIDCEEEKIFKAADVLASMMKDCEKGEFNKISRDVWIGEIDE